jgi:hypothetical protein
MKWFNFTKEKYNHLFLAIVILTNFLHKCHVNITYKVIGDQIEDPIDYSWYRDF